MLTEKQHQEWKNDLIELQKLQAENERLKEQVGDLRAAIDLLEQLQAENVQLKKQVGDLRVATELARLSLRRNYR